MTSLAAKKQNDFYMQNVANVTAMQKCRTVPTQSNEDVCLTHSHQHIIGLQTAFDPIEKKFQMGFTEMKPGFKVLYFFVCLLYLIV